MVSVLLREYSSPSYPGKIRDILENPRYPGKSDMQVAQTEIWWLRLTCQWPGRHKRLPRLLQQRYRVHSLFYIRYKYACTNVICWYLFYRVRTHHQDHDYVGYPRSPLISVCQGITASFHISDHRLFRFANISWLHAISPDHRLCRFAQNIMASYNISAIAIFSGFAKSILVLQNISNQ